MKDSTVVSADAAQILTQCRIDSATVRDLLGAFKSSADRITTHGAGWHGPDEISTLEGLGSEYLWGENPVQPARMRFAFDAGHVGSQGRYTLTPLAGPHEEGVFHSVPNNPAIGWAFVALLPKGGAPRPLIVKGMFTDVAGRIVILLLSRTDAHGPVDPPFAAQRIA